VSQPFSFFTPLIGEVLGDVITLSASATAPVLNPLDASVLPVAGPTATPAPTPTPTAAPTPTPTPAPTATPTPAPTTPGATPTATPVPTATPKPTPTPTPTPVPTCKVPNFKNGFWNNTGGVPALQVWHDQAGFTGTLTNLAGTDKIKTQEIRKNTVVPCSTGMWVSK
jgi:hypothetical protein